MNIDMSVIKILIMLFLCLPLSECKSEEDKEAWRQQYNALKNLEQNYNMSNLHESSKWGLKRKLKQMKKIFLNQTLPSEREDVYNFLYKKKKTPKKINLLNLPQEFIKYDTLQKFQKRIDKKIHQSKSLSIHIFSLVKTQTSVIEDNFRLLSKEVRQLEDVTKMNQKLLEAEKNKLQKQLVPFTTPHSSRYECDKVVDQIQKRILKIRAQYTILRNGAFEEARSKTVRVKNQVKTIKLLIGEDISSQIETTDLEDEKNQERETRFPEDIEEYYTTGNLDLKISILSKIMDENLRLAKSLKNYQKRIEVVIRPLFLQMENILNSLEPVVYSQSEAKLFVIELEIENFLRSIQEITHIYTKNFKAGAGFKQTMEAIFRGTKAMFETFQRNKDFQREKEFSDYVAKLQSIMEE